MKSKKNKHNKKRKLNKKRLLIALFVLILFAFFIYKLANVNIKNIYIKGNNFLSDQEIIDLAGLKNYPKTFDNMSYEIEDKLNKNIYINDSKVTKSNLFRTINIEVKENYPMFYYQAEEKTVLYNGKKITDKLYAPTVINQIPNTIYDKFLKRMQEIDTSILNKISEIQYKPNDVDEERFLLIMDDNNYVYINIRKFVTLNKYTDIIKSFDGKKGILYLDSGEYFEVFN